MASQNLIGKYVKSRREASELTQDQLAGACQRLGWDVSRVSIAKIETGVRAVNEAEVVVLSVALSCQASDLIKGITIEEAIHLVRQGRSGG